ncbi:MAG TPA: hypothetical protein VI341_04905 [Actinomycetota bacterium]
MTSKVVRAIRTHQLAAKPHVEGRPPSATRVAFEKIVLRLTGGHFGRRF